MAKKNDKKTTNVRTHPLHVDVSKKNPTGLTTRHQHERRLKGTYLNQDEIEQIFENYSRKGIGNPKATGIIQITPETFEILQSSTKEVKEFIFVDIRKKDLKDPAICIPMGIRWLHRKKRLAEGKLGDKPDHEDIILEYKGLLKSKSESEYKKSRLKKYWDAYA